MRFSAVGGRAGLQARVPGLDEMGFSPGGNAWSIYEMGTSHWRYGRRWTKSVRHSEGRPALGGSISGTLRFA